MIVSRLICLFVGYCFGLFQTGYLYGKAHNIDIRQHGSGNTGTTNTLRTLGYKAGLITFLGDLLKAIIPMFIAWFLLKDKYPDSIRVFVMYAGLGAVLGHNYPFYMKFKGGKGIACTSGFILAFYPAFVPACIILFVVSVAITKYVSLGSILVVVSFLTQLIIFGQYGYLNTSKKSLTEIYIIGIVFTLLAIWKHRENIKRLMNGTENKLSVGSKKEE